MDPYYLTWIYICGSSTTMSLLDLSKTIYILNNIKGSNVTLNEQHLSHVYNLFTTTQGLRLLDNFINSLNPYHKAESMDIVNSIDKYPIKYYLNYAMYKRCFSSLLFLGYFNLPDIHTITSYLQYLLNSVQSKNKAVLTDSNIYSSLKIPINIKKCIKELQSSISNVYPSLIVQSVHDIPYDILTMHYRHTSSLQLDTFVHNLFEHTQMYNIMCLYCLINNTVNDLNKRKWKIVQKAYCFIDAYNMSIHISKNVINYCININWTHNSPIINGVQNYKIKTYIFISNLIYKEMLSYVYNESLLKTNHSNTKDIYVYSKRFTYFNEINSLYKISQFSKNEIQNFINIVMIVVEIYYYLYRLIQDHQLNLSNLLHKDIDGYNSLFTATNTNEYSHVSIRFNVNHPKASFIYSYLKDKLTSGNIRQSQSTTKLPEMANIFPWFSLLILLKSDTFWNKLKHCYYQEAGVSMPLLLYIFFVIGHILNHNLSLGDILNNSNTSLKMNSDTVDLFIRSGIHFIFTSILFINLFLFSAPFLVRGERKIKQLSSNRFNIKRMKGTPVNTTRQRNYTWENFINNKKEQFSVISLSSGHKVMHSNYISQFSDILTKTNKTLSCSLNFELFHVFIDPYHISKISNRYPSIAQLYKYALATIILARHLSSVTDNLKMYINGRINAVHKATIQYLLNEAKSTDINGNLFFKIYKKIIKMMISIKHISNTYILYKLGYIFLRFLNNSNAFKNLLIDDITYLLDKHTVYREATKHTDSKCVASKPHYIRRYK